MCVFARGLDSYLKMTQDSCQNDSSFYESRHDRHVLWLACQVGRLLIHDSTCDSSSVASTPPCRYNEQMDGKDISFLLSKRGRKGWKIHLYTFLRSQIVGTGHISEPPISDIYRPILDWFSPREENKPNVSLLSSKLTVIMRNIQIRPDILKYNWWCPQ